MNEQDLIQFKKDQREILWQNRLQTIALVLSFFGILNLTGIFKKK